LVTALGGIFAGAITAQDKKYLTLLDPHPDELEMGHGFQNPTFDKVKDDIVNEYLGKNGIYTEKEKEHK
jgi:hypothetical protein